MTEEMLFTQVHVPLSSIYFHLAILSSATQSPNLCYKELQLKCLEKELEFEGIEYRWLGKSANPSSGIESLWGEFQGRVVVIE